MIAVRLAANPQQGGTGNAPEGRWDPTNLAADLSPLTLVASFPSLSGRIRLRSLAVQFRMPPVLRSGRNSPPGDLLPGLTPVSCIASICPPAHEKASPGEDAPGKSISREREETLENDPRPASPGGPARTPPRLRSTWSASFAAVRSRHLGPLDSPQPAAPHQLGFPLCPQLRANAWIGRPGSEAGSAGRRRSRPKSTVSMSLGSVWC